MVNLKKIIFVLFKVFLVLILLETGLRIGGYLYLRFQLSGDELTGASIVNTNKDTYRIVTFGDSHTQGVPTSPEESYPAYLQKLFDEQVKDKNVQIINKGIGGMNSGELLNNFDSFISETNPDLIIIEIGAANWFNRYRYGAYLNRKDNNKSEIAQELYSLQDQLYQLRVYKLLAYISNQIKYRLISQKELFFKKNLTGSEEQENVAEIFEGYSINFESDNPRDYENIGSTYLYQGDYEEAVNWFIKGIISDPDFRDLYAENRNYAYLRKVYQETDNETLKKRIDEFVNQFKTTNPANSENLLLLTREDVLSWIESDIREILRIAKDKNVTIVLQTYHPDLNNRRFRGVNAVLRKIANDTGVQIIDNWAIFQELQNEGEDIVKYYRTVNNAIDVDVIDVHLNYEGNKIVAKNIFDFIIKENMLQLDK